ncbi:amino acid adenylation domain-containing protein [Actinoplanes sp. NEAU-A12]|uniref:Amino acid adenylation domain-containing protein n=1 Tax=Actinoplanes sandaracinus TaxID=3045177 RepID=A0ABT6WZL7_9ACTN|nr:non-ribosomal peptide synthetase [Actinoplanes sandaracinus]MDI6105191.1 amino acid adenylation domain-containing protein [Actinoplanes sandaracinus]
MRFDIRHDDQSAGRGGSAPPPAVELILDQAVRTPQAPAVECHGDQLTYAELATQSARIAAHLHGLGVRRGDLVGVAVPRGVALVAALLGVHRAGAAYVPLDPEHPVERLTHILTDARARVLLTSKSAPPMPATSATLIHIEDIPSAAVAVLPTVEAVDAAYVIYTSGSTGRPKGVLVSHGSLSNFLLSMRHRPGLAPGAAFPAVTTVSFDIAALELFLPLMVGGRVVLSDHTEAQDPYRLAALLARCAAHVMQATPVTWRMLLDSGWQPPAGFVALCGGEKLPSDLAERLRATGIDLWDLYGPTETTVWSSVTRIGTDGTPDFHPVANTTLYVLDDRLDPAAEGELYIGGDGVAAGYLGQPALTADRFVPDPFDVVPGRRLYRTGDLARHHPAGWIEILGRADHQIKVRGFRIEPGDIETCLTGHPSVRTAVVTAYEPAPGDRQLVAYLVPADVDVSAVRAHVAARLPGYLVPDAFVALPELPVTPNGKVDRRALPAPNRDRATRDIVPPRTPAERAAATAMAEVVGAAAVGLHDRFFEVGGDSIRAVRLIGLLRAQGYDYSVQDLYRHQSVADLIAHAVGGGTDRTGTEPFALLDPADRARVPAAVVDAYPMTQAQVGMVYELLADPAGRPYHNVLSHLVRDSEPVVAAELATAVTAVVAVHEVLRTSFDLTTFTEPMQLVHATAAVEFGYTDLRAHPADRRQSLLDAFREAERDRTFDLAAAPLLRVHAHQMTDNRWYLTVTECHAILDGWSHDAIVAQILARYRGEAPPDVPTVRYADFVAHERRSSTDPADRTFWSDRLAGANRLTIPAAWAALDEPPAYTIIVPFADLADDLRALAERAGTPLKSVLLATHLAVWRTVAGTGPFYSGLVCNGRPEVAGGDLVAGMFLNPVPFTTRPGGTWLELVQAVFAEETDLWPHRRYPLLELQRVHGDGGRLLDVAFNYVDSAVLTAAGIDVAGSIDLSPNEFPFAVSTQDGGLVLRARSAAVGRRHGELLAAMYRQALTAMTSDPTGDSRQSLLPPAERRRLLAVGERTPRPAGGVPDLVAAQVARTPDAVAVDGVGGRLTYRALHDRALTWAARLRAAGVRRTDLVGVALGREPDLVAALLGVLYAGGAYVPIDPAHPLERIVGLIRDAGPRVLIAPPDLAGRITDRPVLVPEPDHLDGVVVSPTNPEDLVYVVHTSGSTGRPKGVMARHGALVDRTLSMRRNVGLGPADVVVMVVPVITDVAQLATFVALTSGARLVLAAGNLARDPESLGELLRDVGGTFMQAAPSTWRMLLESGWTPPAGFRVLSGGEAPNTDLVRRLCATPAQVWNMYGPNEATVFCFGTQLTGGTRWVPAANTAIYLLDEDLEPVPDGVPGQIFVGGSGLARGYLGQPASTADVFLPDPYTEVTGGRMYATGDIGRRTGGGIEILGRRDHQLKIRGFRVELGEIENTLSGHPGVRAAVVHPIPGPQGEAQLAAYVIGDLTGLREYAARRLPSHLVPTHLVPLESFPRLPNGKIDRAALPRPDASRPAIDTTFVAPQGAVEQTIAAVWADTLGIEQVGRDDDFFALGGHSLLLLRVIARLRQNGIDRTFRDFLAQRTVRGLAAAQPDGTRQTALTWLARRADRTPLFCVHPGGGSALWYVDLADALAAERPVAAFEWPGLRGDERPHASVPEIAAEYLAELRAAQPAGPYTLLGWCGSTGIAWEMASRLRAAGEKTHLILLDPVVDTATRAVLQHNLDVFRRAEALAATGSQEVQDELRAVLRDLVDDGDSLLAAVDDEKDRVSRLRSWRELLEARLGYRFRPYPGPVDLLLSADFAGDDDAGRAASLDDYVEHWRRLATNGIRLHKVPGGHWAAVRPPYVKSLAATLTSLLDG